MVVRPLGRLGRSAWTTAAGDAHRGRGVGWATPFLLPAWWQVGLRSRLLVPTLLSCLLSSRGASLLEFVRRSVEPNLAQVRSSLIGIDRDVHVGLGSFRVRLCLIVVHRGVLLGRHARGCRAVP